MRTVLIAVMGAVVLAAAPADAQEEVVLAPALAAGQASVPVPPSRPFTRRTAARSVRRVLREHGYAAVTARCKRPRERVARCRVSATSGGAEWSGSATVTRGKRAHRVEYEVLSGSDD